MVSSMTAYARHASQQAWGRAVWEIRSVNHRFLEISLRLPEEFRGLENAIREQIGTRVKRGKVDCTLRHEGAAAETVDLAINTALVQGLAKAHDEVAHLVGHGGPVSAFDFLRWPGVLASSVLDLDAVREPLLADLDTALAELCDTRRREGAKLKALIEARLEEARGHVARLRVQLPAILQGLKERLLARVADLGATLDPGRLEQEMVLLAQKLDVAEELDRLEAHVDEVTRVLAQKEPVGRRLDFLMQELNREANTLGSKSQHLDTTGASVDLKVLIEQMREQIQNIE